MNKLFTSTSNGGFAQLTPSLSVHQRETKFNQCFSFLVILLLGTILQAQTGGQIYQKYGGQHAGGVGNSYYWPDYVDGVNDQHPECFDYSMGNNSTPAYEMRNATISFNRARNQINSSSNVFRPSTGQQTIKFVETDINTRAFRKTEFAYPNPALGWFHTSQTNGSFNYMSGAIHNAQIFPHPLISGASVYTTGQGMIKRFELNANTNADIYTRYLGNAVSSPFNTDRFQDVIVKVIEHGGFIYAVGYCAHNPGYGTGKGLIYKIPVNYFDQTISCNTATCAGAELYTIGNFVSDIMEINGEIYFVGSIMRGATVSAFIGALNRNYYREDVNNVCATGQHGEPFMPSMNFNPNTNEIECLIIDHHASFSGIIAYDLNLNQSGTYTAFELSRLNIGGLNPNHNVITPPPAGLLFKDLEYDQNFNFIISGHIFMGANVHKVSLTLDRNTGMIQGGIYRPPVNMRAGTPLINNNAATMPSPMQEMIFYDNSSGQEFVYSSENYDFNQRAIANVKRMDYGLLQNALDDDCQDCHQLSLTLPTSTQCVDLHHEDHLQREDFEIETNPMVHRLQIEEDYPMHCTDSVEDGIAGCPYWDEDIVMANITSPFNTSAEICMGDEFRLGAMQKNFYGTTTLQWFHNGIAIPNTADRLTIRRTQIGTYHFEATRTQYNGTTCTFVSNPLTITETKSEIVATPSDELCQGQGATLSVSGSVPSKFTWPAFSDGPAYGVGSWIPHGTWFRWANIFVYTPTIGVQPTPYRYDVEVEYPNGCKTTLYKDIKRKGIYLNQNISETGSATETLSIEVCNWDLAPINNVQISTNLAPNNIVNALPNTGGWLQAGSTHTFTISSLPAATDMYTPACTTITMQVRVNKCASSLAVQGVYSTMTCPPVVSTRNYWDANNFTANITNTTGVSCNAAPLTLNGTPATGGYTYQWLRGTGTIPISTTNTCVANTTDRYHFHVSRNQCTQTKFIDVIMNPAINFTETTTPAVCNTQGTITVSATGGTPPYQYQARPQDPFITSNVLNVAFGGTYNVVVKDSRGCTFTKAVTVGSTNYTVNFSETITPVTCTAGGSISITNPTTTGSCASGTFTYLWSNGATTATVNNLGSGNISVTVTDCNGCTKVKTLTVPNLSNVITAEVVSSLMNCTTTPAQVRYTVYPTGGTAPYTFQWYQNGTAITGETNAYYTTTNSTNLTVKISDATYCTIKAISTAAPTTYFIGSDYSKPKMSTAGIPTYVYNARVYIKGNLEIDVNTGWIHTEVIFETPTSTSTSTSVTIKKPSTTQIGLYAKNSHIHTCNAEMQKGFIIHDNAFAMIENCLIQDMYTAFQLIADADLRLHSNTTLENNFIGIKLLNNTATSYNLNSGWQFSIKGGTSKLVPNNRYNTANLSFSSLEPAGTSMTTYTKSYAGIISDNSTGWTLTTQSGLPPIQISNLANGILVKGGDYTLSKIQFKDIRDVSNIYGGTCSTCKREIAISAEATSSAARSVSYTGLGSSTLDIDNTGKGITTSNYSLTAQNLKIDNVQDRAIEATSNNATTHYNKSLNITNCNIKAKKPIHSAYMQTNNIQNNILEDIGTVATQAPMVEVLSTSNWTPNAIISNNTFKINLSSYGLSVSNLKSGSNATTQINVSNNKFNILNTSAGAVNTRTWAGANFNNLQNVLISGNTLTKGGAVLNFTLNSTNDAPYGISSITVQNGTYSCNNFYTTTGSYFEGTSNGLLIKTNNYSSPKIGMLFNNYTNSTAIPTNSNKFYCGCCGTNTLKNLSTTISKVNISNQSNQSLSTLCSGTTVPTCTSPTPLPFIYFDQFKIDNASYYTPLGNSAGNSGDNSCQLICYNPPPVPQAPEQKMAPSEKSLDIVSAPSCTLFPNPSTDKVKIVLTGIDDSHQTWQVFITDIQGRKVYTQSHNSESNSFELIHDLPSGQYFVSISNGADLNFMERISVISNK